jgi:3D (Asp-Asp-Asp) domain-containing protein
MRNGRAMVARAGLSMLLALLWGPPLSAEPLAGEARAQAPDPGKLPLGARELKLGDTGADVKTLNWALRGAFLGTRGAKLTKRTIGVAHRILPCGTRVVLAHKGRWVRAKVIDRGPFRKGYRWDATWALAERLGLRRLGAAKLKVGVVP